MKSADLDRIVKDIRAVARAIDTRWKQNRATWGVKSAADRIRRTVDEAALERCITFLLDQEAPAGTARGYAAAQRLDALLRTLRTLERHRTEIESRLRAA